jgi:hypothetical protein
MSKDENYLSVDIDDLQAALEAAEAIKEHLEDALEWAHRAQDTLVDVRPIGDAREREGKGYQDRAGESRDAALEAADKVSATLSRLRAFRD